MKRQTKTFLALIITALAIVWVLFFLIGFGPVSPEVSAYSAFEDGTLVVCLRDRFLLVHRDGAVESVRCGMHSPSSVKTAENMITLYGYGSYLEYDLLTGSFGERTHLPEATKQQDLKSIITCGSSDYAYRSVWGRYSIYEINSNGDEALRYKMPILDYAVKLCAIIFGIILFSSIPFFVIHVYRNYKLTDKGWKLKTEQKSKS